MVLLGTKDNRTLCDGGVSEMVDFELSFGGEARKQIELQQEEDCLKK